MKESKEVVISSPFPPSQRPLPQTQGFVGDNGLFVAPTYGYPRPPDVKGTTADRKSVRWALRSNALMFIPLLLACGTLLVASGVFHDDLKNDPDAYSCDQWYIEGASDAADGSLRGPPQFGRECKLFYTGSVIGISASSISMAMLFVQGIPAGINSLYPRPAAHPFVLLLNVAFALSAFPLYLTSALIYTTSKVLTHPVEDDPSYRQIVYLALSMAWFCAVVTLVQASLVLWAWRQIWHKGTQDREISTRGISSPSSYNPQISAPYRAESITPRTDSVEIEDEDTDEEDVPRRERREREAALKYYT